jgi:hypothetical protein
MPSGTPGRIGICLASIVLRAALASAQTAGTLTGAISGTVTDETGAVIAKVTVEVSGEGLMAPRVAETGTDGRYRLSAIPPGIYAVSFARGGFQSVRIDNLIVSIGVTVTLPATLRIATIDRTEDVTVESRLLDRFATAVAARFGPDQIDSLPNSRTVFAVLSATAGVQVARFEVGGASGDAAAPYAAYGTSGSNRPSLEGINLAGLFPLGVALDYGALSEVTVFTAAHGPEWSAPGVHMHLIGKSGSNTYRGTIYADYENRRWQAFNIDADQIARGASGGTVPAREANRVWSYYDAGADAGGFVVRDRLWWYASGRDQDLSVRQVNFPVQPVRSRLMNLSGKITARAGRTGTLIGYVHAGRNHRPTRLDPFGAGGLTATSALNDSAAATVAQRAWSLVWKGEWNAAIGDRLFLEARGGQFVAHRPEAPNGHGPRYEDIVTLEVSGGNRDWEQRLRRAQMTGTATYFAGGRVGRHHLKAGAEVWQQTNGEIWRRSYPGDVLHVLQAGTPSRVYVFDTPSRSEDGLWSGSAYVSDSWQVNGRLTLNLGLRFDRARLFLPPQSHPAGYISAVPQTFPAVENLIDWNVTVPRLGAVIDLGGDGRTIGKLVYGTYAISPNSAVAGNANRNQPLWWHLYPWSDINGNLVWDPGEEDRDMRLGSRGGVELESIDPALELPSLAEAGGWIERELPARIRLRGGVLWRRGRNHAARQNIHTPAAAFTVPVPVRDPGRDGRDGTADDGETIQAYQLDPAIAFRQEFRLQNVPGAETEFWTWDVTAERRGSGRWALFSAGLAVTGYAEHAASLFGQPVRQNQYPLTPNDLINTRDGGRYRFSMWTVKAHGTYDGPWGLRVTPHLRHQSGQPFGRTFVKRLNYGDVRILAEPIGTRRMAHVTLLDVRLERSFRAGARRVAAFVDVFNLLNGNPEQNLSWSSGTFLRPLAIVPPRVARIGVRVNW